MPYMALYRKYRPLNFDEIVGQKSIVTTLKNQLRTGKISHAYLFCGMRGTGKTSTARVFAKALNCEKGPAENPCNACPSCQAINSGSMMDVIEMDAASNRGIDDIRELRDKVNFAPSSGRYKVYIIDEVHMLTTEAFNALLKTLEEPPGYVVFILATTEPNKLPSTILSRCMRFDFTRISTAEIVDRLEQIVQDVGIKAEKKALKQIAAYSQGSVRDALSLLDKALAFGGEKLSHEGVLELLGAVSTRVFYDISRAVVEQNSRTLLDIVDEVAKQGKDLFRFIDDLLEHFRNLLMVSIDADRTLIDVIDEDYEKLRQIAKKYTAEKLLSIINILKDVANEVKWSSQPRIIIETAMVKLALPQLWKNEEGYISRIQQLEHQVKQLSEMLQNVNYKSAAGLLNQQEGQENCEKQNEKKESQEKGISKDFENVSTSSEDGKSAEKLGNQTRDEKGLKGILEKWPKILEYLISKGKMGVVAVIKTGGVKPVKLEGSKLYLENNGDCVYEEIIMNEKHIIEKIIKELTDVDVTIKGFVKEATSSGRSSKLLDNQNINGDNGNVKDESLQSDEAKADEEFAKKVIDFFGEDLVTFQN